MLKQYLHLSNLNEKNQVSGNLKFLDLNDEAILEEKKIFEVGTQFFFSLRSAFIYFDFDSDTHKKHNKQI